jgi:hypothetical protein
MTPLRLITRSMRKAGVIGLGQLPDPDEQQDLLEDLNEFIATLARENLFIPYRTRSAMTFTTGDEVLTVGDGGDIDIAKPDTIDRVTIADSEGNERTLHRHLNQLEWASVANKTTTSTQPTDVYYEPEVPLGKLHVHPVPTADVDGFLYYHGILTAFTTLTETIEMPRGYLNMLIQNFSIECAIDHDMVPSQYLIARAAESKGAIKSANMRPRQMVTESALMNSGGIGGPSYDINTDSWM